MSTVLEFASKKYATIEDAVCLSGGLDNPESHFDAQTLEAAHSQFRHGIGLRDLLNIAAADGGHGRHWGADVGGLLRAAFSPQSLVQASDGFSTLGISGILSNVANKFLLQGFNAVEDTWRLVADRTSVRDFKQTSLYRMTGGMEFEKVGPAGELRHGTLGEVSYNNQAETYGKMLAITRKDIINDDLGALTKAPMRLGRGAALAFNSVFWTEFLADVGTFWSSGNANVVTGAGSALSSAGLKSAADTFKKQTDPDGNPIGSMPRVLLVPTELEITADELMTSTAVNTGGSSTTDKVPNRNIWTSKFKVASSVYLSNPNIPNYSAAAWWLLADPADIATIEVAFLNGRDTPTVESASADFDTLGIKFRGFFDFGIRKQEYRGSVRSAGS